MTDKPTDLMAQLDRDMEKMFGRFTPPEPLSDEEMAEGDLTAELR